MTKPTRPAIAIIIPCYRVSTHIENVIRAIPDRYETIICVDDASPDDTADRITAVHDSRVTLIRHTENRGVGGAMKTGYAAALARGAEICVKMDGDGQMSVDDLEPLIEPLRSGAADYSKGNRFPDLAALRQMPIRRLVGNALLSFASKAVCGYWNMLDVTNGFTAIRADILRQIESSRLSDRYFFETSMLLELNLLRASTADVEMPARYGDEVSSLRLARVLATFPPLLVRGLLRRLYWRYIVGEFGVVSLCLLLGAPLVLFGIAFGVWHWSASIRTGVPATAGTVFVAALPIILGFQLLLVAIVLDVLASPTLKRRVRRTHLGPE